jgi:hypothetical protein
MSGLRYTLAAYAAVMMLASTAQATEPAQTASATAIWGERAKGKTYRIEEQVESDGLYRTYVFETSVGKFTVISDALMARRLHEYAVFEQLQEDSGVAHFLGSFGTSAIAPLKFGGQLLISPVETTKQSFQGVGNFLDSLSASGENKDPERGSFMGGVLGTDSARRQLAAQVRVDPFTDFPPLATRLQELAAARGMGGLSMSGAMMAIPGGAALPSLTANTTRTVVYTASSAGSAQALQDALRNKTAGQITRDAKEKLANLASAKVIEAFVDNNNYTPTDIYVIALALERIKAGNTELFLQKCASVQERTSAYLRRRQAEMYAGLHRNLPIARFFEANGYLLTQLKDKRALLAMPADHFLWTDRNKQDFVELRESIPAQITDKPTKPGKDKLVVITGEFSPMAKTELGKLQWDTARISLTELH